MKSVLSLQSFEIHFLVPLTGRLPHKFSFNLNWFISEFLCDSLVTTRQSFYCKDLTFSVSYILQTVCCSSDAGIARKISFSESSGILLSKMAVYSCLLLSQEIRYISHLSINNKFEKAFTWISCNDVNGASFLLMCLNFSLCYAVTVFLFDNRKTRSTFNTDYWRTALSSGIFWLTNKGGFISQGMMGGHYRLVSL